MKAQYIFIEKVNNRQAKYQCSGCKKFFIRYINNVTSGKSVCCQKCGSGQANKFPEKFKGLYKSRIYNIWDSMVRRSTNKNHRDYFRYGAKNRTLEEKKWKNFTGFAEDMYENYLEHYKIYGNNTSLDRIDNSKGYCKKNCRWVTQKEQMRNTSVNRLYTIDNKTKCLEEWCEIYKIAQNTVKGRISKGWEIKKAITTPPNGWTQLVSNTGVKCITKTKAGYFVYRTKNTYRGAFKTLQEAIKFKENYERTV